MKKAWKILSILSRKLAGSQVAFSLLAVMVAVCVMGAAAIEQLSCDPTTRACAQNVNFTGTSTKIAGIEYSTATDSATASTIMKRSVANAVAATTFIGALTGNASTATVGSTATVALDASTSANMYLLWGTATSGNLPLKASTVLTWNPGTATFSATNISATTFTGALTGNASGSSGSCTGNSATATLASTVTVADTTDTDAFIGIFESATGSLAAKTDAGLTYNAGTGTLTATAFNGPLTGDVTGNATGSSGTCTGNAATATLASTITAAASTDTDAYVAFFEEATGSLGAKTDAGLTYNATTNALTATTFVGALTGNASGTSANVTGTVAVANGGTGAATAGAALTALGIRRGLSVAMTAGTVVVLDASTTANSVIIPARLASLGELEAGAFYVDSQTAGWGFSVKSSNAADTARVNWIAVEP